MTERVDSFIWECHFVGTETTYIYNHFESFMIIYSEKTQKPINTVPMHFGNYEDFKENCHRVFSDVVVEMWGLN